MRNLLLLLLILSSGIVIAGALAKMQHWPIANWLLAAGMLMEVGCGIGFAVLSWRGRKEG